MVGLIVKKFDGINTFTGEKELTKFLKQVDILVCMLPLTPKLEDT